MLDPGRWTSADTAAAGANPLGHPRPPGPGSTRSASSASAIPFGVVASMVAVQRRAAHVPTPECAPRCGRRAGWRRTSSSGSSSPRSAPGSWTGRCTARRSPPRSRRSPPPRRSRCSATGCSRSTAAAAGVHRGRGGGGQLRGVRDRVRGGRRAGRRRSGGPRRRARRRARSRSRPGARPRPGRPDALRPREPRPRWRGMGDELDAAGEPADALPGLARAVAETLGAPACGSSRTRARPRSGPVGDELEEPALERCSATAAAARAARASVRARRARPSAGRPRARRGARAAARARGRRGRAGRAAPALARQIVTAREEERRRLRRDLHDGLGPALAGIALTLQAAQNTGGAARRRARHGRPRADAGRRSPRSAGSCRPAAGGARRPRAGRRDPRACRPARAARGRDRRSRPSRRRPVGRRRARRSTGSRPRRSPTSSATRTRARCRIALRSDGGETVLEVDRRRPRPRPRSRSRRRAALDARARRRARRPASSSARRRSAGSRSRSGCRGAGAGMIRVLVVDDNAVFRQGMRDLFASVPDFEVSAVAGDGAGGRRRRARAPGRRRPDGPRDARG